MSHLARGLELASELRDLGGPFPPNLSQLICVRCLGVP